MLVDASSRVGGWRQCLDEIPHSASAQAVGTKELKPEVRMTRSHMVFQVGISPLTPLGGMGTSAETCVFLEMMDSGRNVTGGCSETLVVME